MEFSALYIYIYIYLVFKHKKVQTFTTYYQTDCAPFAIENKTDLFK